MVGGRAPQRAARRPRRLLTRATLDDAAELLELRAQVAAHLAERHGRRRPRSRGTVRGERWRMQRDTVWVLRQRGRIVAALALGTRKPWAIDASRFAPAERPLYLTDMQVDPEHQGRGLGRRCLAEVPTIAVEWPADAVRLDAYDRADGAGDFYVKCGFREIARVRYRNTPLIYYELRI